MKHLTGRIPSLLSCSTPQRTPQQLYCVDFTEIKLTMYWRVSTCFPCEPSSVLKLKPQAASTSHNAPSLAKHIYTTAFAELVSWQSHTGCCAQEEWRRADEVCSEILAAPGPMTDWGRLLEPFPFFTAFKNYLQVQNWITISNWSIATRPES